MKNRHMFKCNCPHEVRPGCLEPKCPHYAGDRVAQHIAQIDEMAGRVGGTFEVDPAKLSAFKASRPS